tara:strand:- start:205 stop:381 length:177 start_codon:yes stop_codon:yes gene_type:complete
MFGGAQVLLGVGRVEICVRRLRTHAKHYTIPKENKPINPQKLNKNMQKIKQNKPDDNK